jgi:hypothetical protein
VPLFDGLVLVLFQNGVDHAQPMAPAWAALSLVLAGSPAGPSSAASCARFRGRSQTLSQPRVDFDPLRIPLAVHVHRVPLSTCLRCFTIPAFSSTELTKRKIRRWSSFPPPRHAACAA